MAYRIPSASVWEQDVYDALADHIEGEREIVQEYQALAARTADPSVRYLAELILDDERRHHELFVQLAEAVRSAAELRPSDLPAPDVLGRDRDEILETTQRFLEVERADARVLDDLAKQLRPVRDTTLWYLLVKLMRDDTDKHIRILNFLRDHARHPVL